MNWPNDGNAEMIELLSAMTDGGLSEFQCHRLRTLVAGDCNLRDFYLSFVEVDAMLTWEHGMIPPCTDTPFNTSIERPKEMADHKASSVARWSNLFTAFSTADYLSNWPVAYLIATVILGIGGLIGANMHVSDPVQVAERLPGVTRDRAVTEPQMESVGRITGMVDCMWGESAAAPVTGTVRLGQKYQLASGLMEITYHTGAKVILQGPVMFEAKSPSSGYLSLGKLTVRLEKRRGGDREGGEHSVLGSPNRKTPPHASLFSVRTPTAIVTDLGTEFGVEVDEAAQTTSHVFSGVIQVQAIDADGNASSAVRVLHENETVCVKQGDSERPMLVVPSKKPLNFVRDIHKPIVRAFDLVDVVAGGNGFSGRRNRGIDPTSGQPSDVPSKPEFLRMKGDGKYHRVEGLPFVDGVFIPDGGSGSVQVDSAGHTFANFADSNNSSDGYFWAGGDIPFNKQEERPIPIPTTLSGIDYASPGHGLLFMHANKGITFDLEAIRRANPGWKLLQFHAVAGNLIGESKIDLGVVSFWALVDGQVRFYRHGVNGWNGGLSVVFTIGKNDRFLTLVAIEDGTGIGGAWTMFGDPRIECAPVF